MGGAQVLLKGPPRLLLLPSPAPLWMALRLPGAHSSPERSGRRGLLLQLSKDAGLVRWRKPGEEPERHPRKSGHRGLCGARPRSLPERKPGDGGGGAAEAAGPGAAEFAPQLGLPIAAAAAAPSAAAAGAIRFRCAGKGRGETLPFAWMGGGVA